jgi:hypothetical protein
VQQIIKQFQHWSEVDYNNMKKDNMKKDNMKKDNMKKDLLNNIEIVINGQVSDDPNMINDYITGLIPPGRTKIYATPKICTYIQLSPHFHTDDANPHISYKKIGVYTNPNTKWTTDIHRTKQSDDKNCNQVERIISEEGVTIVRIIFDIFGIVNTVDQMKCSYNKFEVKEIGEIEDHRIEALKEHLDRCLQLFGNDN